MGTVIVREYPDQARDRSGRTTTLVEGMLVTDQHGLSIKTVTTVAGTPGDVGPLTTQTHIVALEGNVAFRYAVWPPEFVRTPAWSATQSYAVGHQVLLSNRHYTCLEATVAGESPATAADKWQLFAATANHSPVASGAVAVVPVYPGAKISILDTTP